MKKNIPSQFAIGLVPGADCFLRFCPLSQNHFGGLSSFTSLFVVCEGEKAMIINACPLKCKLL